MSKNQAKAVMLYSNQWKRFQLWNHLETHCSEISHSCFEWASLWLQKTKLLQSRQYDGDKWSDGGFVSKKIIEWIHLSLVNLDDVAQSENQAKQSLGSARRAQKTCKRLRGSSRGGGGVGGWRLCWWWQYYLWIMTIIEDLQKTQTMPATTTMTIHKSSKQWLLQW